MMERREGRGRKRALKNIWASTMCLQLVFASTLR